MPERLRASEDLDLPKVLYFSDVPVELIYAGATLVYRLFEHYPKEKLLIVQGMELNPAARIPGVKYVVLKSKFVERLITSRIKNWSSWLQVGRHLVPSRKLNKIIRDFRPEAVVTVTYHLMWLRAESIARSLGIPVHTILHDDWLTTEKYGSLQSYVARRFKDLYSESHSRFCICPNMEQYYHRLYQVHGDVMLPFRGKGDEKYSVNVKEGKMSLSYCYAGTLFVGDFLPMLDTLAAVLGETGDQLHIYSNFEKPPAVKYANLARGHVTFHNLVRPAHLMKIMNEEMDVAILLNSFEAEESFRYNFSSKLVDYTSAGLPVLGWGPPTSGTLSWLRTAGYDCLVHDGQDTALRTQVVMMKEVRRRYDLSRKMGELSAHFDFAPNFRLFSERVAGTEANPG
jgi:hypothetical protein